MANEVTHAMELLDLPVELVVMLISEMINVVGLHNSNEMRRVNSKTLMLHNLTYNQLTMTEFFNTTVLDISLSQPNAHLLSRFCIVDPSLKAKCAAILMKRVDECCSSGRSNPFVATLRGALALLERYYHDETELMTSLQRIHLNGSDAEASCETQRPSWKSRRLEYILALCKSIIYRTSLKAAFGFLIENKSRNEGQDVNPKQTLEVAMLAASALGDVPLMQALIDDGAEVTERTVYFGSMGDAAAMNGHYEAVLFLLERIQYDWRDTIPPAVASDHTSMVEKFINQHDFKLQHDLRGLAFLHALHLQSPDMIAMLLGYGIEIVAQTFGEKTAKSILDRKGEVRPAEQSELLLARGIDKRTSLPGSALIWVAQGDLKDTIKRLHDNGAETRYLLMVPPRIRWPKTHVLIRFKQEGTCSIDNKEQDIFILSLEKETSFMRRKPGDASGFKCAAGDENRCLLMGNNRSGDFGTARLPSHHCFWTQVEDWPRQKS